MGSSPGRGGWSSELPERIGKYTVLGHLATGGMAEVYLARQQGIEGFEKTVVLKRMRPELTLERSTVSQFLDEARLVATLEHPNIAQVYEADVVNGMYFFVMEYVYGADLRQLLKRADKLGRELSIANALYIIIEVCKGLHYAHDKCGPRGNPLGIIHRDVSPSNVLVSHDGVVKVCDFGVAKAAERSNAETLRGVLKGKLSYMSPEQCRSEPLDRRSDVFAIGIVLYEATTQTPLFRAKSDFELMRTIVDDPIPPPSSRLLGYPPELERIVMRALARRRDDRYATAQDLQLALEGFARERKLALSSVHIKQLMVDLFQIGERIRKARDTKHPQGSGLDEERTDVDAEVFPPASPVLGIDTEPVPAVTESVQAITPVVTPVNVPVPPPPPPPPPVTVAVRRTPVNPPVAMAVGSDARPAPVAPVRRVPWWGAAGIGVGIALAAGATIAAPDDASGPQPEIRDEVTASAAAIRTALDAAEATARVRAQGIATTPRLRAAIDTDAATVKDLFETELAFSPGRGEAIEVSRIDAGQRTLLLRLPPSAEPIPAGGQPGSRFERRGDELAAVVEAPIENLANRRAGVVSFAATIGLADVRARIAAHAARASLIVRAPVGGSLGGKGLELPLVAGAGAAATEPITVAVRDRDPALQLVAYPIAAAAPDSESLTIFAIVRYAGLALALAFALLLAVRLLRAPRG